MWSGVGGEEFGAKIWGVCVDRNVVWFDGGGAGVDDGGGGIGGEGIMAGVEGVLVDGEGVKVDCGAFSR